MGSPCGSTGTDDFALSMNIPSVRPREARRRKRSSLWPTGETQGSVRTHETREIVVAPGFEVL